MKLSTVTAHHLQDVNFSWRVAPRRYLLLTEQVENIALGCDLESEHSAKDYFTTNS